MKFTETNLKGAYILELEKLEDERGYFARTWCEEEFQKHGLVAKIAQANTSFNRLAGTVRGMHFQTAPHEETKFVRCTRGAIYDVIIDLRPDSSSYRQWTGVELAAENGAALYIPAGFAHGFMTLEDNSEVSYLMSDSYAPEVARGLRWDDPLFTVEWPRPVAVISSRDVSWSDYVEQQPGL